MTTKRTTATTTTTTTTPNDTPNTNTNTVNTGLYLRWSRIIKTVTIKADNSGLLRGSIAAPTKESNESFIRRRTNSKKNGNNKKEEKKNILKEVSGYAAPGEIVAMMGPSGSGKTSLLNCLSGRNPYNSGIVSVNGRPLGSGEQNGSGSDMKRLMSRIAYVKQDDIFFEHLTVRDQLGYTALLRLPQLWTHTRKMNEVNRIIRLLRLTKVADSKIQMLSGGEKKRVNIGTELLTDPAVLLLDEPTSGLDSTSAVALIQMLSKLARNSNKTIITSIHQPSSALFFGFDRLIMLAEGHVVYFGQPKQSLLYLKEHGLDCPLGYNGADHWMDLLVQDSAIDDDEDDDIIEDGDVENTTAIVAVTTTAVSLSDGTGSGTNTDDDDKDEYEPSKYATSWGLQYRTLVHRSLKNSRSAIFTPINVIKSCALGIISGLLWYQMDYTESRVFDRSSYFFFTMTFWVFDAMFQSFMAFPSERTVILKERASGSYRLSAYFMGKTTSEMPARLVLPLIYMVISFWMASISTSFSMFVATTFISLLSVMAGEAIGLLVGATIYDTEKGMTFMTVISLFLALVGGFFVENVPSFLVWTKYLSPFKYSFDASLQLVFDKPVPCDGSGALEALCGGSSTGYAQPEQVIEYLGVQGSVGFNVGILIAIGLVPRYLAYLALRAKKEGDR
ncbi:P-loop containing nucleoside triphosphate hydrolase protein [Fragilariopsis cylindrus CCMP1102]|uniref:p-loop containing nucleoside triphosphate hydrolase protein n=1 Tax=Fragilariopsis cylindrus CCMP1102 TaxID=635003 RepID=A0A1E7FJB9_9STRA|nr:P-loop containing nucleoside triphosphate hydrolase protein [Fragilariopsis cylindrus CCMP1102]|eukprot:OEU18279.1 P-loop containing nucleoside triphosphate hydrolase protein [Fragilariopsis cylindrus CCMP1102]